MENWQVAILTLTALVVGLSIPVLLQLRSTLREVQHRVRDVGGRAAAVLDDAAGIAARVRRVTDGMDGQEEQVGELLRSAGDLARTLDGLRSTAHVATAAAAAVVAGFRAFRDVQAGGGVESADEPERDARSPEPDPAEETRPAPSANAGTAPSHDEDFQQPNTPNERRDTTMTNPKHYGTSHLLLSFLGGAAAGAAVALLTAKRSGRETREQIAGALQTGKDKTAQLPGAVKAATGAAREAFSEAMGNGS